MKKLILLAPLVLALAACGGGTTNQPAPPPPYSAIGTWDIRVLPDGVTDQRVLGLATFTAQNAQGGLDGKFFNNVGAYAGEAVGNAQAGSLGFVFGLTNVISVQGTFIGNSYKGRYQVVGTSSAAGSKGALEMTRR